MTIAATMTPVDLKLTPPARPERPTQRKAWDAYYEPRNAAFRKANPQGKDLVRWKYQRYMHDYLGCVKAVDDSVGRILKYLDDEGLAENTIVVYSSDQGFYLGEHGWFDKRWIFEESTPDPLLVRWPGVTKRRARRPLAGLERRLRRDVPRSRRPADPPETCKAGASCRSSRGSTRPTGGSRSIMNITNIPSRAPRPTAITASSPSGTS